MRRLTFKGYLESYVRSLAGENTLALPRLAELCRSEPRLAEPLLLWATASGNSTRLLGLLGDCPDLRLELETLVDMHGTGSLSTVLASEDPRLRPEYSKVWRSYVVRRDAPKRDAQLKADVRTRVLALESSKAVSRYRMAKDLGLNPGNLHAYLTQGNVSKLSLDRVAELVEYLEAA